MIPIIHDSVEDMIKPSGGDTSIDVELEIIERKLSNMEDDDKDMPELIRKRHDLRRKSRIERLTKELAELQKKEGVSEEADEKEGDDA
mgnify:CR=1 FL=1|jgi:polyhydroxyalkanoate synthesis regulator phasin|tara:strand:- start:10056 stop:10319 length:264 start_codon:yes stop_codon:yes gene_type:complete